MENENEATAGREGGALTEEQRAARHFAVLLKAEAAKAEARTGRRYEPEGMVKVLLSTRVGG